MWKTQVKPQARQLEGNKLLLIFSSETEATGALLSASGKAWFIASRITLSRWSSLGCSDRQAIGYGHWWVRVFGVPLHAWCTAVFKEIGDAAGGFIEADPSNLSWSKLDSLRLLIWSRSVYDVPKFVGLEILGTSYVLRLEVEDGDSKTGKRNSASDPLNGEWLREGATCDTERLCRFSGVGDRRSDQPTSAVIRGAQRPPPISKENGGPKRRRRRRCKRIH
uniref:DUF4283 domain-containing protein n=1 Tax=Nelumbo nucifera TaxID=4432 RepID=A0A822Z053_NELNU|nr:TPA_asm: hypothetical protein HUJ06_014057 [Nelumbo nucifera]